MNLSITSWQNGNGCLSGIVFSLIILISIVHRYNAHTSLLYLSSHMCCAASSPCSSMNFFILSVYGTNCIGFLAGDVLYSKKFFLNRSVVLALKNACSISVYLLTLLVTTGVSSYVCMRNVKLGICAGNPVTSKYASICV